ncbi:MAG: ribosome maturation factor RimP [Bowdeniella nasicola]|nr:ribosome maturation factor RimP [Bowdeniella nasicola]
MRQDAVRHEVATLAEPRAKAAGLYIEDIQVADAGRKSRVRVVVDLPDGPGGVDADQIADFSRELSAALDENDVVPGSYTLEVSTPGLSRPLTTARHYRRNEGHDVEIQTGSDRVIGTVLGATHDTLSLDVDGEQRDFPLATIASGRVHLKF